jgi:hypothetical protein
MENHAVCFLCGTAVHLLITDAPLIIIIQDLITDYHRKCSPLMAVETAGDFFW